MWKHYHKESRDERVTFTHILILFGVEKYDKRNDQSTDRPHTNHIVEDNITYFSKTLISIAEESIPRTSSNKKLKSWFNEVYM